MQDNSGSKKEDISDKSFFKRFSKLSSFLDEDLGSGFCRLSISEAEKRQAKHDIRWVEDALLELLRNSRDAGATRIAVATALHSNRFREIIVIDNGEGIPEDYHDVIFQPRVTSRVSEYVEDEYGVHGRGMALYAIRMNAEQAAVAFSDLYKGTSIRVLFDVEKLPERKNQAEKPYVKKTEQGYEIRGVKNILYTLTEFAIKNPKIDIYYGSFSEILSLIIEDAAFEPLKSSILRKIFDVQDVIYLAEKLGMKISMRNAYRILNREVGKAVSVSARNIFKKTAKSGGYVVRFNEEDWVLVKSRLQESLKPFLERYSLKVTEVTQKRKDGTLKIQLILEENEELM